MRALIAVLLLALTLPAFGARAVLRPEPGDVHVSMTNGPHGMHKLTGGFTVAASTEAAWQILTDYDHMSAFVSSVKASRRLRREANGWLVEQVMSGNAGFFRKRVHLVLKVTEVPQQQVAFEDVLKKSFKVYRGKWQIENDGHQLHVLYTLEATPASFSPDFIAVGAFKKNVRRLLEEVRNEIIERSKWAMKQHDEQPS